MVYSRNSGYVRSGNIYGGVPENYGGNAFRDRDDVEFPDDLPETDEKTAPEPKPETAGNAPSIFPGSIADRFPFGHGVGSEEMLILGVMLAVMNSTSGESHNDMLLLLALLLFSG